MTQIGKMLMNEGTQKEIQQGIGEKALKMLHKEGLFITLLLMVSWQEK